LGGVVSGVVPEGGVLSGVVVLVSPVVPVVPVVPLVPVAPPVPLVPDVVPDVAGVAVSPVVAGVVSLRLQAPSMVVSRAAVRRIFAGFFIDDSSVSWLPVKI
jgi:hypothetical protein